MPAHRHPCGGNFRYFAKVLEGELATPRRLPFSVRTLGDTSTLTLNSLSLGPLIVEHLELEVADVGTQPGPAVRAERFQRRRTHLRAVTLRVTAPKLDEWVEQIRKPLAGFGISQISAHLNDGFVAVRARVTEGLTAADLSFQIYLVNAGTHVRALGTAIRIHGHLPTPGPVIADRILDAMLCATDAPGVVERPHARGLCDVEIDLVNALLWYLMPPSGWRLPAVSDIELINIRVGRAAIEIGYGPVGSRGGELGVRTQTLQIAAAHDLMHSVDQLAREGRVDEALRGYRGLLAAGGPEQPVLLERILALTSSRPTWFFDGIELARQALGRWPQFAPAHATLGSIALAQGDAREAAAQLGQVAHLAAVEGDDDQAALAALAGARLLRVLDPKAATQLYQLALEHDPSSTEAADALADRLADEHRWPELVRLVRARAVSTTDSTRAVQLRLRLADVFAHELDDPTSAQQELGLARELAPNDPAVHEMTAAVLGGIDRMSAIDAWREVARLAETRQDHRAGARAWAAIGDLLAALPHDDAATVGSMDAEHAWNKALALDPLQSDAIAGLAQAATARNDHAAAAGFYERLRGLGLPQDIAATHELALARSLVSLGRIDDARTSLRRAALGGGETAAEAHAVLAEIAEVGADSEHAAVELDTAITSLVEIAHHDHGGGERLYARAAELSVIRASLFDRTGHADAAIEDWERAHALARDHAPTIARDAARTLLDRAGPDAGIERQWIDAVLATRPPPVERATLLVRRADVRRREPKPDLAAAIADLHEAIQLTEDLSEPPAIAVRRDAYQLEAALLAQSGDQRARAQALAALARIAEREADRVEVETAAAAAWLAANEPAAALPHGARAEASLEAGGPEVPPALRREVLVTLGEAAWRQRSWSEVIRAYRGLIADPGAEAPRLGAFRYRLAVAADRSGDPALALDTLRPMVENFQPDPGIPAELRGQALRLFADLAERAGDLGGAAAALEGFAAVPVDNSPRARADAMYRAGELFRRAGRDEDAIRCLEAALRISESHLPALDALELAWRDRGDLERVAVILGRKVAATARHPARQKPLLSRLGDLQDQLDRPEVALATHQRALEIDAQWRPSLRFVIQRARETGEHVEAVQGLAQLTGELPGDSTADPGGVSRERQDALHGLCELVSEMPAHELDVVRELGLAALIPKSDTSALDDPLVIAALAKLRGGQVQPVLRDADTASGRLSNPSLSALSLREAAGIAREAGKLDEAFATLETANNVNPGDVTVLEQLIELAGKLGDHEAAARHLTSLADLATGARRGAALLELADVYYDRLDDLTRARQSMRAAAEAFGSGTRHESTLRMLATEAATNLAWELAAESLSAIVWERRTSIDVSSLANALLRAGRVAEAVETVEIATARRRFDDGGELLQKLRAELARKSELADQLETRAASAASEDAAQMRQEAHQLREQASPGAGPGAIARIKLKSVPVQPVEPPAELPPEEPGDLEVPVERPTEEVGWQSVSDPSLRSGSPRAATAPPAGPTETPEPAIEPSITVAGTPDETVSAVIAAAQGASRERLLAAHHEDPDDAGVLLALITHLADREPGLRREILEQVSISGRGRALAIALHELALIARESYQPTHASALWQRARTIDPTYAPVWMPLADAYAAADELDTARELYEAVAASSEYDASRRKFAADRAEALGRDDSVVGGELKGTATPVAPARAELAAASELAHAGNIDAAIAAAERAAGAATAGDTAALALLERLYVEANNVAAASEAIGRQLVVVTEDVQRSVLWRRRAKLYRDTPGRDAEVYRCLKEAHACAPSDPEIAYQLRTAAMVRGEWALAASLIYREIAATNNPRDRGALHLELALIYLERLDDAPQAQVNFEQALAFDPTIPAVKLPLARRYEAIGLYAEAAKFYEEAASSARAADRAELLDSAARCRTNAIEATGEPGLAAQLDRAEAAGELVAALALANELWAEEPGHPAAFRLLANEHRASGDLAALTALTEVRTSHASTPDERSAAWLGVARLAEDVGALDQAASAFDRALAENPGHAGTLDARGALAFKMGDYATADRIYRHVGAGDSVLGDDELALRRSIIAERLGRDPEALAHAQDAANAAPGRRDVLARVQELATRLGDLSGALVAARGAVDLIPLEDDEAQLSAKFAVVDLLRRTGDIDRAATLLERMLRDHPMTPRVIELLAEIHIARADWASATRYLYQLVPLAPSAQERADRLYRLGEAVLVHLGDVDRADDVFLRASDLDPGHVPTLLRLLDVYWRADDPAAIVEVATELAEKGALGNGPPAEGALAHAMVAAALLGDTQLATRIGEAMGELAPTRIAGALVELDGRSGRIQLASASTAITELARRGVVDLAKVRAAASGTSVERMLTLTQQ